MQSRNRGHPPRLGFQNACLAEPARYRSLDADQHEFVIQILVNQSDRFVRADCIAQQSQTVVFHQSPLAAGKRRVLAQAAVVLDLLDRVSDDRAGANPERDLMRRELGSKIAQALTKLTPRERMVFELKHYQGLRLRTIGEMLNTTEETAKNTLFRATQKLRSTLAPMRR